MSIQRVAFVFLIFIATIGLTGATAWTDCADASKAHWSVSSFDAEPNPVVAGQNITVNLIFETNGVVVQDGTVETEVFFSALGKFIKVHSESDELCGVEVQCPVQQSVVKIFNSAQIPSSAPSASYMNKIEILDKSGNVVGCVSYDYSITH